MSALNPFDKGGKPNATLADRIIIAIMFGLLAITAVAIPFLIIAWYQKANDRQRVIFWVFFLLLAFAGFVYKAWLYS